jgi:hypothetical protein
VASVSEVDVAESLKYLELNLLGMMFRHVMIMFDDIARLNQLIVHRDIEVD